MTRSDIRTNVRYNIRETTANVWTDSELNGHIDLAQRYVASKLSSRYLPELVQFGSDTVALPTTSYALDTDFMKMAGNPTVNGGEYPLVDPEEGVRTSNYGTNHIFSNKKVSYVLNDLLYFSYIASGDGATSIVWPYVKWPDDLSADGTASEIQDSVIDLVIDYATSRALAKTDVEESLVHKTSVDKRIMELNESRST